MASRPPCDRLYRPVAAFFSQQGPAPASSVGAEGEHPLDVPCHGHEAPLAAHLVEPAQQELAESEYRFDDAEHRFRGLFAQSIELPAFWRFQPMRHGLDRRWVFRRGRCIGEAFGQGWMMRLSAHGDQRLDPCRLAGRHIPRAEIAGIGQQRFGLAQFFRQGVDLAEHRFELLLVVRGLNDIGGNHQKAALRHRSLRVVALLEAAAGYRHDARLFVGEIDLIGQQRTLRRGPRRLAAWLLAGATFVAMENHRTDSIPNDSYPVKSDRLLVLLSQKVAREARPDSGKGRDSDISRWGLIWISERQTTVNRDLRGMSRGL